MSTHKVKIKVIHVDNWKHLQFVKIIKEHTGLGLKDAKDLSDDIKIIGEEVLVSSERSIYEDNIVDKKSTFSHYTTGTLTFHNLTKYE